MWIFKFLVWMDIFMLFGVIWEKKNDNFWVFNCIKILFEKIIEDILVFVKLILFIDYIVLSKDCGVLFCFGVIVIILVFVW